MTLREIAGRLIARAKSRLGRARQIVARLDREDVEALREAGQAVREAVRDGAIDEKEAEDLFLIGLALVERFRVKPEPAPLETPDPGGLT